MEPKYVDFMEIYMAVVFCSSMSFEEKINKIFDCMDYDDSDSATLESFTITLKSAEAGLVKEMHAAGITIQDMEGAGVAFEETGHAGLF